MSQHEVRIRNGMKAYELLSELRAGNTDPAIRAAFNDAKQDLGYGLLLKRYTDKVVDATEEQIKSAAKDTIPNVAPLFWSFRISGCRRLPDVTGCCDFLLDCSV